MDFSSFFDYPNQDSDDETEALVFLGAGSEEDWQILLAHTELYRFSPGDVVIQRGVQERSLYLIAAGTFEVLVPRTGGQDVRRLALAETGTVIGEQSFLDGQPHSADVRAVTDGEVFRLTFEAFETLSAREPDLAHEILFDLGRILSARLRQTTQIVSAQG